MVPRESTHTGGPDPKDPPILGFTVPVGIRSALMGGLWDPEGRIFRSGRTQGIPIKRGGCRPSPWPARWVA